MLLIDQEIKVPYGQSKVLSSAVPVVDVVECVLCKFSIIIFLLFSYSNVTSFAAWLCVGCGCYALDTFYLENSQCFDAKNSKMQKRM